MKSSCCQKEAVASQRHSCKVTDIAYWNHDHYLRTSHLSHAHCRKISFTIGFVEDVVCPIPSGGNISVQLQYRIPPGSRQWTTFETYSPTVVTASEAVSLYICDSKLQDVELRWFQSSGLGADWYLDDLSVMQWNKSCYKELLFENFNDPNMWVMLCM